MNTPNISSFNLPKEKFDVEAFKTILKSYENGEIELKTIKRYARLLPKPNHKWYAIRYKTNNGTLLYQGAYELRDVVEAELIKRQQLQLFLLFELTREMTPKLP